MGCGQSKIHLYPRKSKSKSNGKKGGHSKFKIVPFNIELMGNGFKLLLQLMVMEMQKKKKDIL